MSAATDTPVPDANAVPCDGAGRPLHLAQRQSFGVSPHMISFLGGVAVALGIMYICSQFGGRKSRD